jgi:hypothetical protein
VSTPFVTSLRARPGTVTIGTPDASAITIRVQLAEAWDAVRVVVSPAESVAVVKARALEALDPGALPLEGYIVTYRGFEVLDDEVSLATAGVVNGATLFIAYRHRRPVR